MRQLKHIKKNFSLWTLNSVRRLRMLVWFIRWTSLTVKLSKINSYKVIYITCCTQSVYHAVIDIWFISSIINSIIQNRYIVTYYIIISLYQCELYKYRIGGWNKKRSDKKRFQFYFSWKGFFYGLMQYFLLCLL